MRFKWKVAVALLIGGLAPEALVLKMDIDRFSAYSRTVAENEIRTSIGLKAMSVETYVAKVANVAGALAELPETAEALLEFDGAADALLRDTKMVRTCGACANGMRRRPRRPPTRAKRM